MQLAVQQQVLLQEERTHTLSSPYPRNRLAALVGMLLSQSKISAQIRAKRAVL